MKEDFSRNCGRHRRDVYSYQSLEVGEERSRRPPGEGGM